MKRISQLLVCLALSPAALAQTPSGGDHHDHSAHSPPPDASKAPTTSQDHSTHTSPDHSAHHATGAQEDRHAGHEHMAHNAAAAGVLGPYPMSREGTGTSWLPDAAEHAGGHWMNGAWSGMSHTALTLAYTSQSGPRGDSKAFLAGMAMASAQREVGERGVVSLRAMLSPDPLMGKRGYPLLFAAGETADGASLLIDRQHPHDLFMELSASFAHRLNDTDSVFIYGGLPAEPAFGPPAFMHRPAAMDNPEAPISHHWLDSTHITFGAVTAGWVRDRLKLEVSRFRGREPDENRTDIETGALDSSAVRVSWNPNPNWALQGSFADVTSPEGLEPDVDETRWSFSALHTQTYRGLGEVSTTLAFARKIHEGEEALDAWLAEAALRPSSKWTVFSRAERIETAELETSHHGHDHVSTVSKISAGLVRDFDLSRQTRLGVGALVTLSDPGERLAPSYGDQRVSGSVFVRLLTR